MISDLEFDIWALVFLLLIGGVLLYAMMLQERIKDLEKERNK